MTLPIEANSNQSKRRTIVFFMMWVPLALSFLYAYWLEGTIAGTGSYLAAKLYLLAAPILVSVWIFRERVLSPLPNRKQKRVKSIIMGSAFGILTVATIFGVMATPIGQVVRDNRELVGVFMAKLGVLEHFWLFALFLSVIHSYMEEFFWRWFVFGNLSKILPVSGAIALAGIGFASHHVVIISKFVPLPWACLFGAFVGIGGMVWSWLYFKHNSLWGAWISHMIIDFGIMWLGWTLVNG